MIRVKVSTNFPHWPLARQTPGGTGVWGACQFLTNDAPVGNCDFWVVLDGLTQAETVRCPPGNTLLVTCEPPDVRSYPAAFARQFGAVISCHDTLAHPCVLHMQQGLPWMIGAELEHTTLTWTNFMSFHDLETRPIEKTKLLSIVAAKDRVTPGHHARNRFIDLLKDQLGDSVDVFGLGFLPIRDKWDAIAPYKYHLAIENSRVAHYWTEKLADAFLGEAFPIYCGCPNIAEYFSPESMATFDVADTGRAIDVVRQIAASDLCIEHRAAVREAKRRVLYEHNLFAMLTRFIEPVVRGKQAAAEPVTLRPESPDVPRAGGERSLGARLARYLATRRR